MRPEIGDYALLGAASLSADPDLSFPVSSSGPSLEQVMWAKAICAVGQVLQECLRLLVTQVRWRS
jgi:hypothetical protein